MHIPDHEKLRRELESAASNVRTVTDRRRKVTSRNVLIGLLLAALVTSLVLAAVFTSDRGSEPAPAVPNDTALSPQTPRRTSPRPPASSTGPDVPPHPEPPLDAEQPVIHTVQPGETLTRVALRYRVPIEQIADDNAIADPDRIRVGQSLTIRPAHQGVEVIEPGTTLSGYAERHGTTVAALMALNPQITDPDRIQAGGRLRVS